jgi:hypothetical protein
MASLMLRALLALTLVLNGTAIPAAGAADMAPDAAAHAGHHGPDQGSHHTPGGDPADSPTSDCCDGNACNCGCAGPQLVSLPFAAAPRAWAMTPAVFTFESVPFSASLISTPFRPPA